VIRAAIILSKGRSNLATSVITAVKKQTMPSFHDTHGKAISRYFLKCTPKRCIFFIYETPIPKAKHIT
jgi:hypothetical protein